MAVIRKVKTIDQQVHDLGCNSQNIVRPKSLRGINDPTIQTLISTSRANRLAFLPPDQIIIEKTVDGGVTWTDAGISDWVKLSLFSEVRPSIALPKINGVKNLLCGIRITITAMKYDVPDGTPETDKYQYWNSNNVKSTERYCQLKELYFWISSSNDSMGVKVEGAYGSDSNKWYDVFNDDSFYMTGWAGCDYIRFDQKVFGGGTNQTWNGYWNYRITIMTKGLNGTNTMGTGYETQDQIVAEIRGYGDSVWVAPNEYMANDKLYSVDSYKNATFPGLVKSNSGFQGPGTSLTNLNGSNISSGTVAEARIANLPATKITSGTFDAARIPNLDAGKITSGTLSADRIPSLSASKITDGTLSADRLPASGVTAGSYGPSGNQSPAHGGTFSVPSITADAKGRVTSASTKTVTLPTYSTATSSANGLMSATDKSKLDSMTTVPLASGLNMTEGTDGLIFTYVS